MNRSSVLCHRHRVSSSQRAPMRPGPPGWGLGYVFLSALVVWLLGEARRGFVVQLGAFGVAFIGLGLVMERWRRTDAKRVAGKGLVVRA